MDKKLTTKICNFFSKLNEVHTVLIYGSVAKNRQREKSDLDIALLLQKDFKNPLNYQINISRKLDDQLGYETDVLLLNYASPHIAFRAIQEGKIVFQRTNKTLWNSFVVKTISMNEDMEILYRKVRRG